MLNSTYWYPIGESGLSVGKIELNEFELFAETSTIIQNMTTHELGHAMGLAHSPSGNVMKNNCDPAQTTPSDQDLADFEMLWSREWPWDPHNVFQN